jgi:hypothetical protein
MNKQNATYALGASDHEIERLDRQSASIDSDAPAAARWRHRARRACSISAPVSAKSSGAVMLPPVLAGAWGRRRSQQ